MFSAKRFVYLATVVVLGTSQVAMAAQAKEKEEDSAYKWGRWAVLSPAAGGAEPYVAVETPGAEFNARPGEASQFQPEIAGITQPPPIVTPPAGPPAVVPNPPGQLPPIGDGRVRPPEPVPGVGQPPIGDGRRR